MRSTGFTEQSVNKLSTPMITKGSTKPSTLSGWGALGRKSPKTNNGGYLSVPGVKNTLSNSEFGSSYDDYLRQQHETVLRSTKQPSTLETQPAAVGEYEDHINEPKSKILELIKERKLQAASKMAVKKV